MPHFYLIDQSLCKTAGHHFDYSLCIANEAEKNGFQPVVGTHRSFDVCAETQSLFCNKTQFKTIFHNTTYQPHSYLPGLRMPTRSKTPPPFNRELKSPWGRLRQQASRKRLNAFLNQFQSDCAEFFDGISLKHGDEVFFVTVSEIEWLALAKFIASRPDAARANWHFQFHFELFLGLPTDYDRSLAEAEQVKSIFVEASQLTEGLNARFYTTSDELTDQYNRIQVEEFETLSYPVNPNFLQNCETTKNEKVILTCAGGIRREKGLKSYLPDLADKISKCDQLKNKVQIVVQGKPKNLPLGQRKKGTDVIRWEALPSPIYDQLIYQTDIGLLMYDPQVFASRRSSVLGEFLSCGKPIIVTAGTWLHKQIAGPIHQHRKTLFEESNTEIPSHPLGRQREFRKDDAPHVVSVKHSDPTLERVLNLRLRWSSKNEFGTYSRLTFHHFENGARVSTHEEIVTPIVTPLGNNRQNLPAETFVSIEIPQETTDVHISLTNAFSPKSLWLDGVQMNLSVQSQPIPTGVIGIPVANDQAVIEAVKSLLKHQEHYCQTAADNVWNWRHRHAPSQTLHQLLKQSNRDRTSDSEIQLRYAE